jgi:MFS family permease
MGAVFAEGIGLAEDQIAWLMTGTILGGLLFQYPIGRLSDLLPRPLVIMATAVITAAICVAAWVIELRPGAGLYLGAAVFGGLLFSLYPLALAQANDYVDHGRVVDLSRGLMTVFALGALAAPVIGGLLMWLLDPSAMLLQIAVALLPVAVSAAWQRCAAGWKRRPNVRRRAAAAEPQHVDWGGMSCPHEPSRVAVARRCAGPAVRRICLPE